MHAIRHLTATVMAQKDVPMEQIKQILRHKNQSTTEKYIGRLGIVKRHLEVLSNPDVRHAKTNKQKILNVVDKRLENQTKIGVPTGI